MLEGSVILMKVFTAKEVAEKLKLNHNTVLKLMRDGIIPAVKFGNTWRITEEDLLDVMKAK